MKADRSPVLVRWCHQLRGAGDRGLEAGESTELLIPSRVHLPGVSLDDGLIKELMETTKAKTKTEVIHLPMSAFLRRKRIAGFLAQEGKIHLDLDWRRLEEEELKA